jgi:hypothetical protein
MSFNSINNQLLERNFILKLPSLVDRRRRGDLIQMYKIVINIDSIDGNQKNYIFYLFFCSFLIHLI